MLCRVARWWAPTIVAGWMLCGALARAADAIGDVPARAAVPHTETYGGATVLGSSASVHFGAVFAPFGSIREDGLRLRAFAAYGWYTYDGYVSSGGHPAAHAFSARNPLSDLMVGYQLQLGPTTIKAFAGAAYDVHSLDAPDPGYGLAGSAWGVKAALETWTELGGGLFLQADGSWTGAHDLYASRARLGWRMTPALSIGPEAGAYGNIVSHGGLGGAFIRYEWAAGEVSASAGAAGDRNGDTRPYAGASLLLRF